ncbi:MAG: TRIC cation channel family protein [bacterium]
MLEPPLVALILGIMTGVAGGMLRDILCGEAPLIMRREIYATASLAGGLIYLAARAADAPQALAIPIGLLTVFCVRPAAIHWRLALPTFREKVE